MSLEWMFQPCRQPHAGVASQALARQGQLTKPPGSLGRLEDVAVALAAMQGKLRPQVQRVWISIFAADHGVAAEGVSAFPQAVTGEMLRNFARGGAAIGVLARELGAMLEVVHLGTVNDPGPVPGVRRAVIDAQTANFTREPAMNPHALTEALRAGRESVRAAQHDDADLFIAGEMGIGNTTSASALACALLNESVDSLTGAGTGIDEAGMVRKREVIACALSLHAQAGDPLERLRRLGGFEIAAMVGAYIAAAQMGMPVLVDGFISSVAALAATQIQPQVRPWLLFAHRSHERGHARVLQAMQANALLDLDMRLGEGSGAAVAVPLLRMACALHNGMATFDEAGVSTV